MYDDAADCEEQMYVPPHEVDDRAETPMHLLAVPEAVYVHPPDVDYQNSKYILSRLYVCNHIVFAVTVFVRCVIS